jgi:biopolymer transport protein ExbD
MDVSKLVKQNVEMDMTPMIDCVFLLMIFFVLVIDLSQKNLEDLILPRAVFQEPDDKPPENRPIINVLQNGAVIYEGQVAYDPAVDGKDYRKIAELLLNIKKVGLATGKLKDKEENLGGKMVKLMDDPILVRADKWTEWHYVGEIMKQCSQPQIAFWKVELAMSEQDKETKEKNPPRTKK